MNRALLSKHETLNKCCCNVGPPSTTLAQQYNNIYSMSRVCWLACCASGILAQMCFHAGPVCHTPHPVPWVAGDTEIKQLKLLYRSAVWVFTPNQGKRLARPRPNAGPTSPTLAQHWARVGGNVSCSLLPIANVRQRSTCHSASPDWLRSGWNTFIYLLNGLVVRFQGNIFSLKVTCKRSILWGASMAER